MSKCVIKMRNPLGVEVGLICLSRIRSRPPFFECRPITDSPSPILKRPLWGSPTLLWTCRQVSPKTLHLSSPLSWAVSQPSDCLPATMDTTEPRRGGSEEVGHDHDHDHDHVQSPASPEPQQELPDDLPKSLDDRRTVPVYQETEMYDAWQGMCPRCLFPDCTSRTVCSWVVGPPCAATGAEARWRLITS